MNCTTFCCDIPPVGAVQTGDGPVGWYCEGHLKDEIDRRCRAGRPFKVIPWSVIPGDAA